jgi:hypothetical protein
MDKFILIPYEKYQRLQRTINGFGERSKSDETKTPIKTPNKERKTKSPSVPQPPPGIREPEKTKPKNLDWISF